jgi:hypothetical protein
MNDRALPVDRLLPELRRAPLFAEMDERHLRELAAGAPATPPNGSSTCAKG